MQHPQDELKYWLALLFAKDIGPATAKRLLAAFGSPEAVFRASHRDITSVDGIGESRARQITGFRSWERIDRELAAIQTLRADIILYSDADYPESLRPYDDAPLVLYKKGTLEESDRYAVAIVGSRRMTEYGRKAADLMARGLAEKGSRSSAALPGESTPPPIGGRSQPAVAQSRCSAAALIARILPKTGLSSAIFRPAVA